MENNFRTKLQDINKFVVSLELVPGRGAWEGTQEKVMKVAEQAAMGKKVDAVSITDNPGGNTGIKPEAIAREIADLGLETIIHLTCKDKNRNQLESELYSLERLGLTNVLAMSGDFSVDGVTGRPKPVFDYDSTHLIKLITDMNNGLTFSTPRGETSLKPTKFFAGAAISPFKATEAEQFLQYSKLKKKVDNGAQFAITQVGYDVRKFHELLLVIQQMKLNIPAIGNIYIINYPVGKIMNENRIPGCVVTDKMLKQLDEERQSKDKGVGLMLERAAKQYAILKGLGYQGVHLGGSLKYEYIEFIIDRGETLSSNWQKFIKEFDFPQEEGFYLYEKASTGLNKEKLALRSSKKGADFTYKLSRAFHKLFFVPDRYLYPSFQRLSGGIKGTKIEKPFHALEHAAKAILYNCQDCGDCALMDMGYTCPMGDCPKNQRNGPCEGSYHGWCEVYPGQQKCVWVRAYDRLKSYGEEGDLNSYQVSPYNWKLQGTSSWINFYSGKDHSAERLGIKPAKNKENR